MRVTAYAKAVVHPTEDVDKVARALRNLFPAASTTHSGVEVVARIDSAEGLEKLRMMVRSRRIRATVRSLLSKGVEGDRVVFFLNKQAAAVGKLSFYEKGEVMALGPIEVVVETDNPREFIEWLTQ
ncbi:MAG: hypothetical protein NZ956_00700 [Candidatus Caldarchaeum sp.]|nr:hypothetical protein [Candidatus Caldarchaeum sp.]